MSVLLFSLCVWQTRLLVRNIFTIRWRDTCSWRLVHGQWNSLAMLLSQTGETKTNIEKLLLLGFVVALSSFFRSIEPILVAVISELLLLSGINLSERISNVSGYRRFKSENHKFNDKYAFLLSGEWHHNFHRYPQRCNHSFMWFEPDPAFWVICAFEYLQVAHQVNRSGLDEMKADLISSGRFDCIYEGIVKHCRREPVLHRFKYNVFFMMIELDQWTKYAFDDFWLWSSRKNPSKLCFAEFRSEDYLSRDQVIDLFEQDHGEIDRENVRVCLITHWRYFWYHFNPVSYYFLFEKSSNRLLAMVSEVSNTPWLEKCWYLHMAGKDSGWNSSKHRKKMHVSPFIDMPFEYQTDFCVPRDEFCVNWQLRKIEDGQVVPNRFFIASLVSKRVPITPWSLLRVLFRYPAQCALVVFRIHWEALFLWFKVPFYDHPRFRKLEDDSVQVNHGS